MELALRAFRRTTELTPYEWRCHFNRGSAAFRLGRLPEAVASMNRVLMFATDAFVEERAAARTALTRARNFDEVLRALETMFGEETVFVIR